MSHIISKSLTEERAAPKEEVGLSARARIFASCLRNPTDRRLAGADFSWSARDALPRWIQEIISRSPEFRALIQPNGAGSPRDRVVARLVGAELDQEELF